MLRRAAKPIDRTETSLPGPPDLSHIVLPLMADDPEVRAIDRKIRDVVNRLALAEEREARAKSRARSRSNGGVSVGQGVVKALLAGGKIDSSSPADEAEAAWQEQRILRDEFNKLQDERTEIVGKLSFEVNTSFQELNNKMQLATLKAAEHLWECYTRNFDLRNIITSSGYSYRDDVLKQFGLRGAHMIGDPAYYGGEGFQFRRFLIDRGVIAAPEADNAE